MKQEVEFKQNEIVSNPVRVINKGTRRATIYLELSAPRDWTTLRSSDKSYTVAPGDSIFIPVRLIPKGRVEGNTKYSINGMLRTDNGIPLGVGSFFCFTKKVVKWDMSVGPDEKIYFKNEQDQVNFELTLENTGNYSEDFQMTLNGGQRDDLILLDTLGNIIRQPSYTLSLDKNQDTTLNFAVKPVQFKRNFRNVSLISHRPFTTTLEQRYRYYAITEEAKDVDSNSVRRGTKIDFIRLGNEKRINPFGSDYIPLIVEAQFQNILSDFTVLSLNLNGMKQFSDDRRLTYFSQLFFSQNNFNTELLRNTPWFIGYSTRRWDVQVGNVNGRTIGMPSAGKGINGSYAVNDAHRVGGHVTLSPRINNNRLTSYGVFHKYTGKNNFRVMTTFARNEYKDSGLNINVLSSRVNKRIAKGHNASVIGAISRSGSTALSPARTGYMVGATYSGQMLDTKLRATLNGRLTSRTFSAANTSAQIFNGRLVYQLKGVWQAQLLSNYQNNKRYGGLSQDSLKSEFTNFNNRLNVVASTENGVFQPGIYYNVQEQPMFKVHSRGLAFNYSNFNFKKNILFSTTILAGYNNPFEFSDIKEYFTANWNMLLRVKTLTMNMTYNYGPSNPLLLNTVFSQFAYPKRFRGAVQHQHLFRNSRFVLQSNASYAFNNQLSSHNLGFFPELFYFNSTGWRFSVRANCNYLSSDVGAAVADISQNLGLQRNDPGPTNSTNVQMGVSIRKEIGIPIPFTEEMNHDVEFISFYDLDGNGVHDNNEPTLENVVIRLFADEVITNIDGEAAMRNVEAGEYPFMVIPLNESKGWFPSVPDTLLIEHDLVMSIPFVRGIKVSGQVMIDLDKRTTEANEMFDLSNLKVAANNGKAYHTLTDKEGNFEFYLPNGDYTITLDENIFTDKYRLMQNNIPVTLANDLESMFVSFFIVEKRRKANIKKFGVDKD